MAAKKIVKRVRRKPLVVKDYALPKDLKGPLFAEVTLLQRFLTERGKIIGRARTGVSAKEQRLISNAIKYARHLALLPFVSRG